MDLAVKKVELIEWLVRLQDEKLIKQIEALRRGSVKDSYELRMPKNMSELQEKLDRSEQSIRTGHIQTQEDVEIFFKAKVGK
jgi:hypothetical protein